MGDVPAAVAEGARRTTGATAAIAATEHPSPVSKMPVLVSAKEATPTILLHARLSI